MFFDSGGNISDTSSFFQRRAAVILFVILILLSLAVRVSALRSFNSSVYAGFLMPDEKVYHQWAVRIASGKTGASEAWDFAPLPAYLMAAVYRIFSPDARYIRYLNIILGVLTCCWLCLIGEKLGGTAVGLGACFLAALCSPLIFFSITLMKTALGLFLFSLAILFFLSSFGKNAMAGMFLTGVVSGLLLNVRSNCILMIPVFAWAAPFFFPGSRKRRAGILIIFLAGLCLSVTPFVIRNYRLSGDIALLPAGGFNLYLGNNPENRFPYYRPVSFATSSPSKQAVQFAIEASIRTGRKLSSKEASAYWIHETFRQAAARPTWEQLCRFARKTAALFSRMDSADNWHIGFVSEYIRFFRFPFFGFGVILPLGMAGMAVYPEYRKKYSLLSVFAAYAVSLVIFFPNVRLRLPMLIILIPFAVTGFAGLFSFLRVRDFGKIRLYTAVFTFFAILTFLPVPGADDMSAHCNRHAGLLFSKGRKNEALRYWEMSCRMKGSYSALADISLASYHAGRNNTGEALVYLEKIPDDSFAAADKYEVKGDMLIRERKFAEAADAYRKSLEINAGQERVIEKLIKVCKIYNRSEVADLENRLMYISSFYN